LLALVTDADGEFNTMKRVRLAPAATFVLSLIGAVLIYYFVAPEKRKVLTLPSPQSASEAEELNVYTALIEQLYPESGSGSVIVAERTNDCPPNEKDQGWEEEMLNKILEVSVETFGDYLVKNRECTLLSGHAALTGTYKIISDAETMRIVRNGSQGWREFRDKYTGAIGFITLSRIGFNPEMSQAFVYAGLYRESALSYGTHVLLSKKYGRWQIIHKYEAWRS
jgi:hypothetical protein